MYTYITAWTQYCVIYGREGQAHCKSISSSNWFSSKQETISAVHFIWANDNKQVENGFKCRAEATSKAGEPPSGFRSINPGKDDSSRGSCGAARIQSLAFVNKSIFHRFSSWHQIGGNFAWWCVRLFYRGRDKFAMALLRAVSLSRQTSACSKWLTTQLHQTAATTTKSIRSVMKHRLHQKQKVGETSC